MSNFCHMCGVSWVGSEHRCHIEYATGGNLPPRTPLIMSNPDAEMWNQSWWDTWRALNDAKARIAELERSERALLEGERLAWHRVAELEALQAQYKSRVEFLENESAEQYARIAELEAELERERWFNNNTSAEWTARIAELEAFNQKLRAEKLETHTLLRGAEDDLRDALRALDEQS